MDPSMSEIPSDHNQILALLQSLQAAGQDLDEISPDLSVRLSVEDPNTLTRAPTCMALAWP